MRHTETAIVAGGCFWGMQELFRYHPGVIDTEVGYCGGTLINPVYDDIKSTETGHTEALRITYDPAQLTYRQLLEFFFQIHDPTTANRQGNDRGSSYRSAIFFMNTREKTIAEAIIAEINVSKKWPGKVVTQLIPAMPFYRAEPEHQDYLQRYPQGYTCHWIRPNWTLT